MPEVELHTIPEAARQRLIFWTNREEFSMLLSICRQKMAEAVCEHATLIAAHSPQILKDGPSPSMEICLKRAAEWSLVYDKLRELQAEIVAESRTLLCSNIIKL
jgi:hypothetical protein